MKNTPFYFKILGELTKSKVTYWVFKKIMRIKYFFMGLGILIEAVSSKRKSALEVPEKIENFEDLSWLFFSHFINRGIIKMDFNEAAYLFKIIRENNPNCLIEIGACEGGSTMLIGTAKSKEAEFTSLDIQNNYNKTVKSRLDSNTRIVIGDSKKYIPHQKIDLIFIDGDHSFEGVKSDFEHFLPYLSPGADILFHDAVGNKKYIFVAPPVNFFVKQLESHPDLRFIKDIGSIRHFKKI